MGQPTKCTPETIAAVVAGLKDGAYIVDACRAAGIGRETYRVWMARGQEGQEPYLGFLVAIKEAKVVAKAKLLEIIVVHAAEHWQAAAWILERRHRKQFGRSSQIDAKVTASGAFGPDLSKLTPAEREKLCRGLWEESKRVLGVGLISPLAEESEN